MTKSTTVPMGSRLQAQYSENRLLLHNVNTRLYGYVFLRVSRNLGPDKDGVEGDASSSSIAITGGLVASGEGP